MDIAKYIGLYLLKNNFCYIHGLGNLELKKKPASYDGQTLSSPQYDVELSLSGSIDDNLANFIATHEQTSISKAANALRDFSVATRADLHAGKDVEIPGLGKFTEQNGVIRFITDPNLQYTPPSIPVLRTAKRVEEAPSFRMADPDSEYRGAGMNWSKIGMWIGVLAVLAVIIIFVVRYMNSRKATPAVQETVVAPDTTALTPPVAAQPVDTMQRDTATTTAAAVPTDGQTRVVIGTYPTRAAAERRVKTLSGNGNAVELQAKDSSSFLVLMPISFAPADSVRVLDSLRRLFNPKGVTIYR